MQLDKIQYDSPKVPELIMEAIVNAIGEGKIKVGKELPPERVHGGDRKPRKQKGTAEKRRLYQADQFVDRECKSDIRTGDIQRVQAGHRSRKCGTCLQKGNRRGL